MTVRVILKVGASVFGLSALMLILAPGLFLKLLGLDENAADQQWSMRMIGITLVALSGNMWVNSSNRDDASVKRVGALMALSATSLGVITLAIPTELTWFTILYAAVGFSFGIAYCTALLLKRI